MVVVGGTLVAGSSTNGTTSGPFGGSDASILIGAADALINASLLVGGPYTVANKITVSGGKTASTGYALTLGGSTNNSGTFSGNISLQNDLTVSQAATTGANALYLTGTIDGTQSGRSPELQYTDYPSFNNDGTQLVTFVGPGAINVTGSVSDGTGQLSVANAGGATRLSGSNNYSGTTTVTAGVLTMTPAASGPVLTGQGAILNGGKLVMEYSGSSPKDVIVPDLQANAGSGFQAGRVHTTNAVDTTKAIGWIDDGSKFSVRYTHVGDADLDGKVNTIDFNQLAGNFGKTSGGIWKEGDFNYDGAVNSLDFNALSGTYGSAPIGGSVPAPSLGSVVPEPASIGALTITTTGMMLRRRRR